MNARFHCDGSKCFVKLAGPASLLLLSLGFAACGGNESPSPASRQPAQEAVGKATQPVAAGPQDNGHGRHWRDWEEEEEEEESTTRFSIVRSAAASTANCLQGAAGNVTIRSLGPVEEMTVEVWGLPPRIELDFFVIQVPDAPFGLSWYQGDMETNGNGYARETFVGRFNIETFIVAPGVASAPVVHDALPFRDAASNPTTAPVHTFHLGLWFDSPADAVDAGCPGTVTPFNGDHTAGIQALSSRNFANAAGPLKRVE